MSRKDTEQSSVPHSTPMHRCADRDKTTSSLHMIRSALDGSRLKRLEGGGGVGVRSLGGRTVQKRAKATMVEKPSVKMMKAMPSRPAMNMVVATGSCQLPRASGQKCTVDT